MDLLLGKWVEEHIHSMDENQIKALVHVLDLVLCTILLQLIHIFALLDLSIVFL